MQHLRLNRHISYVFGMKGATNLKWHSDTPSQISTTQSSWEHVVDNLDPDARFEDSAHQVLLYEEMKQSAALDNGKKPLYSDARG